MSARLPVKPLPPVTGNGHNPPSMDREAWRVEHERRRQELELRRIYAGVEDPMLNDLERQAMTETDALARSGALARSSTSAAAAARPWSP